MCEAGGVVVRCFAGLREVCSILLGLCGQIFFSGFWLIWLSNDFLVLFLSRRNFVMRGDEGGRDFVRVKD